MKKIGRFLATLALTLGVLAVCAQGTVLSPSFRTCVSGGTEVELSRCYVEIDTDLCEGGTIWFTVYGDFGRADYSFPVTRCENGDGVVLYRCNPNGYREEAVLFVYSDTLHRNEYSDSGNRCVEYTERYFVLRKRTPYGYIEYRFAV